MGKASSTKKVQRAARAGGRVSSGQPRSLLFPGILTLITLLGVALVVFARQDRLEDDLGGVPQLGDHIHQAIAVNVCGVEQAVIPEWEPTQIGIHSHGDGVMHVHPFSQLGVGSNATLGRFIDSAKDEGGIDFSLSGDKLTYLGKTYEEGDDSCEGVDDPQIRVAYWANLQDEAADPTVTSGGYEDLRLTENGAGFTIFFGDPDGEIPKPSNADQLSALGAADGGSTLPEPEVANTTTTAPGETTTTAPGETTTTAAGDTTTTTAAP